MFKKRWKIFRWSVPAWTVILTLLIVTAGVAAAFLNTFYPTVSITAMDAPIGTYSEFACEIDEGVGSIDTCTDNLDGTATVVVSGVDNDSRLHISARYTTTESHQVWWVVPDPLPAGINEITHFPAVNGTVVNNSTNVFHHYIDLNDLTPSQVLNGGMVIGWEASPTP